MSLKRLPQAERLLSGTLSAYLSAAATEATVNNPPDTNKLPTYIEIEPDTDNAEVVRVIEVVGNVITIERGIYNGGTGVEHQANSTYEQRMSQVHWDAVVLALESGYIIEDPSQTFTRNSTTEFQIENADHTAYYQAGRILRINGSVDCIVESSELSGGHTIVTVSGESLPTPITSVELAIQPRDMTALSTLIIQTIKEKTSGEGVTIDDTLKVDSIAEKTSGAGITVDQLLIKDNLINAAGADSNIDLIIKGKGTGLVLADTPNSIYRQALFNPGCEVYQLAAAVTLTNGKLKGGSDGFYAKGEGTAVSAGTIVQTSSANCGRSGYADKLSGVTLTGSGKIHGYRFIESLNAKLYKNQAASFGVIVYHDVGSAIDFVVKINKANSADNFSAVTNIASASAQSVPNTTATLIKFENVSLGDCSNGIEIEVEGNCGAITTKNFEFAEWQFNLGSVLLPFSCEDFGKELIKCNRIYEKSIRYDYAPNTNNMNVLDAGSWTQVAADTGGLIVNVSFRVMKRTLTPTITIYSPLTTSPAGKIRRSDTGDIVSITAINYINDSGFQGISATVVAGKSYQYGWVADAWPTLA